MRRIKKANISFISLVPAGANKLPAIYKADGSVEVSTLIQAAKDFDEQGELTAVVYAPNLRDSQGDIADESVVKQMAYDFIANGGKVDIRHDGKPVGPEKARVAQTFLVQKSDERFHGWKDRDGNAVDLTGAWATVIKIDDPELRKKYRSGEWAGVSMGGTAIVEQEKSDLESLLKALLSKMNPPNPNQKDEAMDKAELQAMFKEFTTELVKALKPEPKKNEPEEKKDDAPVFKGDVSNPRDVRKHARQVELYALKKGTDWSDPKSIHAYSEAVAALKAEWEQEDAAAGEETEQVSKGSTRDRAPVSGRSNSVVVAGLSKAEQAMLEAGKAIAESFNISKGRATAAK